MISIEKIKRKIFGVVLVFRMSTNLYSTSDTRQQPFLKTLINLSYE